MTIKVEEASYIDDCNDAFLQLFHVMGFGLLVRTISSGARGRVDERATKEEEEEARRSLWRRRDVTAKAKSEQVWPSQRMSELRQDNQPAERRPGHIVGPFWASSTCASEELIVVWSSRGWQYQLERCGGADEMVGSGGGRWFHEKTAVAIGSVGRWRRAGAAGSTTTKRHLVGDM
uniref:Uncharacterized protein n=1 Tax=Oryza punctata TaxID=4537 RepID=A0A0E0KGC4_ORYPU